MSDDVTGVAIAERIIRLGRTLQSRGVEVSLAEIIDAENAAARIEVGSRSQLREALRATMIKTPRHHVAFDAAFDRLFPARPAGNRPSGSGESDIEDLTRALVGGDDLQVFATDLVAAYGGLDGELRGERHHIRRVIRAADLARMMSEARRVDPDMSPDRLRLRVDELKRLIAAEVRAHLGPDDDPTIDTTVEDIEFLNASRVELDQLRAAVRPLARKLASRLARRRRHLRSGRVNVRRTVRRSLGTGGVPLDVLLRRQGSHRPDLFVLCDISGSVAEFSLFTLTLMSSLSAEVDRTRSFVFVDGVDEVTQVLSRTGHGIEPWQLLRNTKAIAADGHSDYGAVLQAFWDRTAERELRPSSTVLVTGDARSNFNDPNSSALRSIAERARRVYWLNPEPRTEWDTSDSVMGLYARHCTEVFEVRNLRQLSDCVEAIL